MKKAITGGCVCGAVRYVIAHKPLLMFNCHCRLCQRLSGSAYTAVMAVAAGAFRLTHGKLHTYSTEKANGGRNIRGFCARCGSRLTGGDGWPNARVIAVAASSLDNPKIFRPAYDIFTSHAQPWDLMDPALPKYKTHRPR